MPDVFLPCLNKGDDDDDDDDLRMHLGNALCRTIRLFV